MKVGVRAPLDSQDFRWNISKFGMLSTSVENICGSQRSDTDPSYYCEKYDKGNDAVAFMLHSLNLAAKIAP